MRVVMIISLHLTVRYDDVIYISGNLYVNSQMSISGCDAWRRLFKVIDV